MRRVPIADRHRWRRKHEQWRPDLLLVEACRVSPDPALPELLAVIAAEQARGAVTVLIDKSSSPTAPMIDYIVDYGTTGSTVKMRRRVMIEKKVRLDITIQASDTIPASDIDRFQDAISNALQWRVQYSTAH